MDDVAFHKAVFEFDRMTVPAVARMLWSLASERNDSATRRVRNWVGDLLGAGKRGRCFNERGEAAAEYAGALGCPLPTQEMLVAVNEYWDGGGFPGRHGGDEIPEGARIVAVAQSVTIWAETMPLADIAERLSGHRGRRFDPEVTRCAMADLENESRDNERWLDRLARDCVTGEVPLAALDLSVTEATQVFGDIVDSKTEFTARHSERVAMLAAAMTEVAGGPTDEIALAGLLHDLGKLAVPNVILEKNGKLTDQEWAKVRRHPADSWAVIDVVDGWRELADVAASHHERPDGKGYHQGLHGDAVPRYGAWLAAADAFDAMTADRPYRDGMDPADALAELERGAGSQFAPEAVDLLATVVAEGRTQASRRAAA